MSTKISFHPSSVMLPNNTCQTDYQTVQGKMLARKTHAVTTKDNTTADGGGNKPGK